MNVASFGRVASKCSVAADKSPFRVSGRGLSPPAVIADAALAGTALSGGRKGRPDIGLWRFAFLRGEHTS